MDPLRLESGKTHEVPVRIADDIAAAGKVPVVTLRLRFDGTPPAAAFTFNGAPLGDPQVSGKEATFPVKAAALEMGDNRIGLTLGETGKRRVNLMDLSVDVRYGTP